jgi:hypothetical protein
MRWGAWAFAMGLGLAPVAAAGDGNSNSGAAEPALRAWLDGSPRDGAGRLVVQAELPDGVEIEVQPPSAEGLTFDPVGEPREEHFGGRSVQTRTWAFHGQNAHYEIHPGALRLPGASAPVTAPSIFLDLGVEPIRPGEIADIEDPSRVWSVPWTLLGVVGGVLALVGGGVAFAFRRPPAAVAQPMVEAPDVRALRAWEAVRRDATLDSHARAVELSRIFREYAEEVLRFPATAWTTSESLEYLASLVHLPQGNVPRAKRLLRATDRVKYAEASMGAELIEEGDADLRAFIEATRPRAWQEGAR